MIPTPLQFHQLEFELFPKTIDLIRKNVKSGLGSAVSVGLWSRHWNRGSSALVFSFGQTRKEPTPGKSVSVETHFDLASLTKVVATAPLVGFLVDRGWLRWDYEVVRFFPQYPFHEVTLAHLVTHTSGLPAWRPYYEEMAAQWGSELVRGSIADRQEWIRSKILSEPLEARPGERCVYSDPSFLLLGYVAEAVLQIPLDAAVRKYVWDRLGLKNLHFILVDRDPLSAVQSDVVATEISKWRGGLIQGQVHDDNCWAMGGFGGHAGVFGNVGDLLEFSRAVFLGRDFSSDHRARIFTPIPSVGRTYGWDLKSKEGSSAGKHFSKESVGHLGFTGTSLWLDPEAGLAIALLTNRVHPSRDHQGIKEFRIRLHETFRSEWEAYERELG